MKIISDSGTQPIDDSSSQPIGGSSRQLWRRLVLFALTTSILALALPHTASAETVVTGPVAQPWMQRCLDRSLVPTPNITVTIKDSLRDSQPPLYYNYTNVNRAEIGLIDTSYWPGNCFVLLHEVGHLFDWTGMNNWQRQYIGCQIMNKQDANPWWGYRDNNGIEYGPGDVINPPVEQFAELYAVAGFIRKFNTQWRLRLPGYAYGVRPLLSPKRIKLLRKYLRYIGREEITRYSTDRRWVNKIKIDPC